MPVRQPPTSVDLTIVHPFDPWAPGPGGLDCWLVDFLRAAPARWRIEVLGVTADAVTRPAGRWLETDWHGRHLRFYGVMEEPMRLVPSRVPASLRFAIACRGRRVEPTGKIRQFQRFESAFAVPNRPGSRTVQGVFNDLTSKVVPPRTLRWHRFPAVFRWLVTSSWRHADTVLVAAPGMAEVVAGHAPRLPNGVIEVGEWADPLVIAPPSPGERDGLRLQLRHDLEWPPDSEVAVFGGRLEKHKGVDIMVKAAGLLRQRPGFRLLIVGDGRERMSLEARVAKLDLARRVAFLDPMPPAELARVYGACDVGVCASERDAGPRFVVEALACGLPVVSTPVGQAVALVDATVGTLLRERSPEALAEAIGETLDRPDRERTREVCLARAALRTPQAMLRPVFDLYEAWLSTRGGDAPDSCPRHR